MGGCHPAQNLHGVVKEVAEAILMTAGPVSTPVAVKSTRNQLHYSTTEQFIQAAKELEKARFGTYYKSIYNNKGKNPVRIFLKRPPSDVEQLLVANPEIYAMRYAKASPKAIGFQLRAKLVELNLVSQDHFM